MRHVEPLSIEAEYVLKFINQTQQHVFLTGKAGTGKTTLLHQITASTHKNFAVVAPTGIAALHAKGVTIHSFFQLPFGTFLPIHEWPPYSTDTKLETKTTLAKHFKMNATKKAVIQQLQLLIIDEVSMLRPDLLDAIEFMLQSVRKNKKSFGGVQVLFIGDLLQLPPVIKDSEWQVLQKYYAGKYFFNAQSIHNKLIYIELEKIFRQKDAFFIDLLNRFRTNTIVQQDIDYLNKYVNHSFSIDKNAGYIILTTHNYKADKINQESLEIIKEKPQSYKAEIVGDFPDKIFPVDENIVLKKGAQVMFIKNDTNAEKRYYNGKIGVVAKLSQNEIFVYFEDDQTTIEVEKYEWQNIKYTLNPTTKEIEEETLGTFVQYPLKLAWAITVHKSQGLTFDKAALDVSQVFQPGQLYVAFSRLRSLEGLILLSSLQVQGFATDNDVISFSNQKIQPQSIESTLIQQTNTYILDFLLECFSWKELEQHYRNIRFASDEASVKLKQKIDEFVTNQENAIRETVLASENFQKQLKNLFFKNEKQEYINSRIEAAYLYFYPIFLKMYEEIVYQLVELQNTKKAKTWFTMFLELEYELSNRLSYLIRAKKIMHLLHANQELNKKNLHAKELIAIKENATQKAKERYKDTHKTLVDFDEFPERYHKTKKPKEPKKSTLEETLELWKQKKSIVEIAQHRKYSVQTIYSHIAKLIAESKIAIQEVLPQDRIDELEILFTNYNGESLTELKEKASNDVTWDELKLYKATLTN